MTAKIIAVYNQKGGCGKTMTTMQLGGAIGLRGYRSMVVDMDPQNTAVTWSSIAEEATPFPARVISLASQFESMVKEVRKFVHDVDVILIDCPPAIESMVPWAALLMADLGLIPVSPVMDNIWASKTACDLGIRAKVENKDLKLAYLVSMTRRGKIFNSCLGVLRKNGKIPVLASTVSLRNAFPESQAWGATVHTLGKGTPATNEIEALTSEVLGILRMEERKNGQT